MHKVGLGIACILAAFVAPVALAHTGQGEAHDFLHGLLHPIFGLDHALAMTAVGALAWSMGGRARVLLPAGFLAMLIAGLISGPMGLVVPHVETAVAATVAAMGVLLLAGRRLPLALPLVCLFGIFHGNAHGAELQAATMAAQAGGFVLGTACLHAAGIAVAAASTALRSRHRPATGTFRLGLFR